MLQHVLFASLAVFALGHVVTGQWPDVLGRLCLLLCVSAPCLSVHTSLLCEDAIVLVNTNSDIDWQLCACVHVRACSVAVDSSQCGSR